jgi:uncharacterized protein with NRDE domain
MCTLTYRLTSQGYQLFFNRDEQKTRPQAIQPTINPSLNAIYPIDTSGGGTWIAAHESGLCLALLNYYQAQVDPVTKNFTSRGVIIPQLLAQHHDIDGQLRKMDLSHFQAFQLCVFSSDLSIQSGKDKLANQYIWDGKTLTSSILSVQDSLPITSSGVDYEVVLASRQRQFKQMILDKQATVNDYIAYHCSQGESGKCSVKMYRDDAQTVSFTQISVDQSKKIGKKVNLDYIDYLISPNAQLLCQKQNHKRSFII